MFGIHAVLVGPNLGAGVLAIGKAVDRCAGDSQAIGRIIIVADFNSCLTGRTIVAVIKGAVAYRQIGGFFSSRLAVKQDGLTVGVEGAVLKPHVCAAPSPDGILVGHLILKSAVNEGRLAIQSQLAFNDAIIVDQFVADDAIKATFACLNGHVFEGESRTALIAQHTALSAYRSGNNIHSLRTVALNCYVTTFLTSVCNAIFQFNRGVLG